MFEGLVVEVKSPIGIESALFLNGEYLSLKSGQLVNSIGCIVSPIFRLADLDNEDWVLFDAVLKVGWTDQARAGALAARRTDQIKKPELNPDLKKELTYGGIQEGAGRMPAQFVFTDKRTHSTFMVRVGKDLNARVSKELKELRASFAKG